MERPAENGLSSAEAAQRLQQFGPNALPNPDQRNLPRIAMDVARQPMFALLLSGALVYLLLGEPLDALILGIFASLSVSIGIIQESRSEKVLQSLRNLASPRALVWRDGSHMRIAGREVVPGDLLILAEGDRVAADAQLLQADDLLADESLLTGESVPVRKRPSLTGDRPTAPGGEDQPFVFAGTLVARGGGLARVFATGTHTEMGQIGQALTSITMEQPRLQRQLRWLLRDFALAGFAVAGLVILLLGLSRGSWLQAALAGIAVGMSVLPEEIPLILAVFMAMGAWRISRAGVLTRRASAIETLGAATVLCTDKTGTLTENRMRLVAIAAGGELWRHGAPLNGRMEDILHAALAASAPIPTDPMDRAIHDAATQAELAMPRELLQSYGLQPELPAVTNVWDAGPPVTPIAYAKGAPETVAELCHLDRDQMSQILRTIDGLAAEGIRLLAVAQAPVSWHGGTRPQSQREISYRYLGLIGFADPLRDTVPAAVRECRAAGIRVVMITGDYPVTARAIARQAGIDAATVVSGDEVEAMDDGALASTVQRCAVFARVRPGQKLRLVEALKRNGEIVAMTGDGVNDAPAMKAAHIGISMGGRGTDVAREASALVLLKDDFASIASAVRLGRRIHDNMRKAIAYVVAVHVPIAGLALLPLLSGLPMMLMPVQIALLEMLIDPACSIVFEAEREESDVMRRPPRPADRPVLPRRAAAMALVQGSVALLFVALALFLAARRGMAENDMRALVFTVLLLMNIGLILTNRAFHASLKDTLLRPNAPLWGLSGTVLTVLGIALYWPPAQRLFRFGPLHGDDLALCLAAGLLLVTIMQAAKHVIARSGQDVP